MTSHKLKLYFAAPLFNEMERAYNFSICNKLQTWFDVFLPQRDGALLVDLIQKGMPVQEAKMRVFENDLAAIRACDVLLILMNGRCVDEGASFELGVAYAGAKVCWALKTDMRQLLPAGDNPMLEGAVRRVFSSTDELFDFLGLGQFASTQELVQDVPVDVIRSRASRGLRQNDS